MLIVNGWTKTTALDDWEQGEIGKAQVYSGDTTFTANDINSLIDRLKLFTCLHDVQVNACDEVGRIDIQGMETADGLFASADDFERWRDGELELYSITYTFYVLEAVPYNIPDQTHDTKEPE